ncbi:gliding motility-associated C-terminal domain-containing protein [Sabulilitoribacter arenilitoris]|uniref:Gliding motility-associated C-terminal domain-containing protein n=1 Tax=Wocania arenilitoris TaxID=2044858 RepID=A0AAE3EPU5_9FLAO|nr:gliding motility-associated C-terminal domain-containing protein [Wocania arenilitoris]MCF7568382.1 gliding motility-associated C-terminal domain-containing protein [Wocania arenilitoris]
MKTKSLLWCAKSFVAFIMVFLWTLHSVNAQCPTITNPTPTAICDASGYTFADLSADYATDTGDGIVWYDADSGGSAFNDNELVAEGIYYIDNISGSCPAPRQSITIDFQVDASNQNLDRIYCSNENATIQTYIDDVLILGIPSGGLVEVYNDFELLSLANSTDLLPVGASIYYIIFEDNTGCRSQIEIGQVGVFSAPTDPTPPTPQLFCSETNPTIADLDSGTTATFAWYQNINGSGEPIPPALSASTALIDGATYYVQIEELFCDSNAIPVTVIIDIPNNPGTSGSLEYCDDNIPSSDFNLFDELAGTPDTNGVWTGPLSTSNGFQGTVSISSLTTPGVYTFTYTVPSNGTCPESTANVVITINETLSSGTVAVINPATFCEKDLPAAFDLSTLLDNEDPGGQWTQGTLSTDPAVSSPIDLTSLTPGTYNFTYTQNLLPNPCPEESTTVQVEVLQDPEAGNAVNQIFCENDLVANSPFNLFDALDGSQDNNSGTWTDSGNNTVSNSIDITGFTVSGSPYLFTYTISNGTCEDSETISITIEPAPESGNALAPFEVCEENVGANSPFDLFSLLDGTQDTNGTWYVGADTSGSVATNPIDISALTDGTYNYTYSVPDIGTCSDVDVTVQIIVFPQPETGTPTTAVFCENDLVGNSPLDLFGQLTGEDSGGTWADDDTTGALTGSDVDLTLLTIGSYNFTYSITSANGCTNNSTVIVTIEDAPESGTVNAPAEFCEALAPVSYNLFDLLSGEDQTGTWNDDDATGTLTGNTVDLSGLTPATYSFTFDVDAIGGCDDVNVTVSVIINPLPNTGTTTAAVFCENDLVANSPLDLFGQLAGEDSGGTWTDDDVSGALTGSDVDLTSLAIGSYNFTYSITDINGCTNSSTVIVTIEDAPESGTPNTPVEFCLADITTGQTYNLFDLLTGEDHTGTWNDDDASGALSGNTVALDGLTQGTYNFTYDVDAIGGCDDVNVTVSIIINDTPPPSATSPQEFCDTATVLDLAATGNSIQWYDVMNGGSVLAGTTALIDGQTYYATQTDVTTGCESSVRTAVSVTIYQSPNAGNPNTTAILACNDNSNIDLDTGLDGTQDSGGVWQDTDATGALSGNSFDATGIAAGTYQFTYFVAGSSPCVDESTVITVTIEEPLNAGTDNTLDVCSNNGTTDLFTLIGSADSGGTWSPALNSGTGVFDPLIDAPGTYTYSLSNGCGTFSSEVVVSVEQAPNAGTDSSITICVIDGVTDLFLSLGSSAQSGGTWSPTLASGTGEFDPNVDTAAVYTYTVAAVSPCTTDSTAQITVTIDDTPTPTVTDATPEFCLVDNPTVADLDSTISSSGTINWYDDAALTIVANATDSLVDGEDYYATQTNSSGCESSTSVSVTVTVNDTPTPTLIASNQELCINDNPMISELTSNINFNSSSHSVVWYDADVGGSVVSESSLLTNGTIYYAVLVDLVTGCESSVRLSVTPDLTSCGDLVIPDGFSPNGDGVNDTFDMDNLGILYPNFEIEIFNRNGNIVYKGNANTPRFNGKSNQSSLGSNDLPVGVYFYIFNFNDGTNKPKQGRLYLSR